jgi:hypothetical protein
MASESKGGDPEDERLFSESTPVYSFFGHSCSTGEVLPVPAGCMLVTLALCGSPTYSDSISERFNDLFWDHERRHLLLDPIGNKEQIEEYLNVPKNTLNVNYPEAELDENKMYMNTLYNAELIHDFKKLQAHPSGLYKYPARLSLIHFDDLLDNLNNGQFMDVFEQIYGDEMVYPVKEDVGKYTVKILRYNLLKSDIMKQIGEKFQITQQELFERYPGIYYLVTCRVPCTESKNVLEKVEKRRRASRPWITNEESKANSELHKERSNLLRLEETTLAEAKEKAKSEFIERLRGTSDNMGATGGAGAAAIRYNGGRHSRRTRRHRKLRSTKRRFKGNRSK